MARKKQAVSNYCQHPPTRLYAWYAPDPTATKKNRHTGAGVGEVRCICCCECGAVLEGGLTLEPVDEPEGEQPKE